MIEIPYLTYVSKDEIIAEKQVTISSLSDENIQLKFENAQLRKLIFGSKSEKHKPTPVDCNQLNMFAEIQEPVQEAEVIPTEVKGYQKTKKKHPGRQALPDHLPVEEILIEPQQDTTGLIKIGEQITETLEYTPASLVRKRYIRPKYAKADGSGIIIADMPDRPLPKSIAEPGLLAHIITSKYVEHMPFYRQIQKFNRDYQLPITSSTINDWFVATCTLLEPLYNTLKQKVLDTDYLQADESPIKVMDNDKKGKTHQGYMWVYHNPINKTILFNYRKGRGMQGPKEILGQYQGVLQCDGYTVYDKIAKTSDITLAGCLAHVRRKYIDAKPQDPIRAQYALDLFSKIYAQEKQAKLSADRQQYRAEHIMPLMDQLKEWITKESIIVLPKSIIGKAMTYTINQWTKIINIFSDSRIELDNNLIENKIRPLALGRKNYLFAGSHNGAKRAAIMYSLFATCKANEVNPYQWLKSTLESIATTSIKDLDNLLPQNYKT